MVVMYYTVEVGNTKIAIGVVGHWASSKDADASVRYSITMY